MADDDNFDIDIYGDGGGYNTNEHVDIKQEGEDPDLVLDEPQQTSQPENSGNQNGAPAEADSHIDSKPVPSLNGDYKMPPQQSTPNDVPAAPHGVKRKEFDDRQADSDATTALLISDLSWWTTDDDVRGWVNQANSEDELKDVTFSEHKVNGKSKGQAFVELTTPQAATATKQQIESFSASGRKYMVHYTNPHSNPFRTLPKDAPMRKDNNRGGMSNNYNAGNQNANFGGGGGGGGGMGMNAGGGGFRGRGGYNNNRGMGGNMGNFNNRGNFNNNMGGGFQSGGGPGMMGGFQGGGMGMPNYGFNNRGGMMGGMRGGPGGMRGGRGGGNMGGMNPMAGGMGMNAMAGGMGMNPMGGGMNPMMGGMGGNMGMQGQGFQGPNPAFNQGFFNNQGSGGDASWNPHGAKRSRQE